MNLRARSSTISVVLTSMSVLCLMLAGCGSSRSSPTGAVRGDGAAICPAAILTASPRAGRAGAKITLAGTYWRPCDDTGAGSSSTDPTATTAITVLIVQGKRSFELAKVDAGPDGKFERTVTLPSALEPGSATITASPGDGNDELGFIDTPSGKVDVDGQVTIQIAAND